MAMMAKVVIFVISLFFILFLFSLNSDAPFASSPPGHERMLVAYSDGTVSYINDTETQDILWSVKIGPPFCESYQSSPDLNAYIYCRRHDLNLYKHDRTKGTVNRVSTHALSDVTLEFRGLDVSAFGSSIHEPIVVDAHTGDVLFRMENGFKSKADKNRMIDKFVIYREDHKVGLRSLIDDSVVWNASVAKFKVETYSSPGLSPSSERKYMPIHLVHIADFDV